MNEEEILRLLEFLGLTSYESKAYLFLVLQGPLTSTELASKSSIPQPRIYDVVNELVKKGLIVVSEGRPRKFSAIAPEKALKKYIESKFIYESNIYNRIISSLKDLTLPNEENIWATSSELGITSLLEEAIEEAESELLIASSPSLLDRFVDMISKKNTSTCIVIYEKDEKCLNALRDFVDEIRLRPTRGPMLVIPDAKYVVTVVGFKKKQSTAYKITDENLKRLFFEYFLGYVRVNSKILYHNLDKILERDYVHLIRAIDHIKILQNLGYSVEVWIEGVKVNGEEKVSLKGIPVSYSENHLAGICTINVKTQDNVEITVGGLGAYLEDVEARKIKIKALTER